MSAPFEVQIAGQPVGGWTRTTLRRDRDDLTGTLTLTCFYGSIPSSPVLRSVAPGAQVTVMVGGQIAFTGSIDKRRGKGHKGKGEKNDAGGDEGEGGVSRSVSIGKDRYEITVTARGKTKRLCDSSHDHPTGQMKNITVGEIIKTLTKNFSVEHEDQSGDNTKIERAVFRDGGLVFHEIHRWSNEHNLITHEGRDGKLKTTKPGNEPRGVDLILGVNILEFSAEQSEADQNSEVKVKGQRTDPKIHGKDAIKRSVGVSMPGVTYSPFVVQLSGDATDERLKKRAQVEARRRNESCKEITIKVFHVQEPSGQPWDIGVKHYVEIPTENIFGDFVVKTLEYSVDVEEIETELTLVPASDSSSGGAGSSLGRSDSQAYGQARQNILGVPVITGLYPSPWSLPQLTFFNPFVSS